MKKIILLASLCSSLAVFAQTYSQDSGKITQFHASNNGAVAVVLDNGYPQASQHEQCTTAVGHWAGETEMDPVIKSALLAAYTSGKTVTITTQGCAPGGGWFKIIDIYLK